MNEDFEFKGYWWLPETPDVQMPGTLSFSPGELLHLELMGYLNQTEEDPIPPPDTIDPPIIHGVASKGKLITIQKCFQTAGTFNISGPSVPTSRFSGHFAFIGVHFESEDQVLFKELFVQFHNLDEWFNKKAFNVEYSRTGPTTISYTQPPPVKTTVDDFHIDFVSLGPSMDYDLGKYATLSQEACVKIWCEVERPLDDFLPILRHIQNFLTLAMTKPTFVVKAEGFTDAAKKIYPDREIHPAVEIYYPAAGRQAKLPKVSWFEMLFTLNAVEGQLEEMLRNWVAKAAIIKPVYDLYFAALYNPSIYSEFRFLSLAQAVETYHRQVYGGKYMTYDEFLAGPYKTLVAAIPAELASDFRSSLKNGKLRYANEYSLRKRLQLLGKHLTEKLDINFLREAKQRNIFAEKVTDTRNYLTHYSPELKDKAATGGEELYVLTQKLRLILQICFLEELSFSFEKIEEIFKKSREYRQYFG